MPVPRPNAPRLPGNTAGRAPARWPLAACLLATLLSPAPFARAAWIDPAWVFRRAVDVEWPDNAPLTGSELAIADIDTAGGHIPSGENARVAAEDGRPLPCRVLMVGPGDRLRILFVPIRGVRRYYVYFGHPRPPAPPSAIADPPIRCGLLVELRQFAGPLPANYRQMESAWKPGQGLIGRTMVNQLFLGHNPLSDEVRVIARFSGTLHIAEEGEYTIAAAASDRGALFLDGKPLLWIPASVGDARFNAKVNLRPGPHDLVAWYANLSGEQRIAVAWKRPTGSKYETIPSLAFGGSLLTARPGILENRQGTLLADMRIEYLGECYFADQYTHRYRFTAQGARPIARPIIEWNFGDGQSATGPAVEHVFLTDGDHPVTLTLRGAGASDTRTQRLHVSRLWDRLDRAPNDAPAAHTRIVSLYDFSRLPTPDLARAARLFLRAGDPSPLQRTATLLAARRDPSDTLLPTLLAAAAELSSTGRFDAASRIWDAVPADVPHATTAAERHASLLLWRIADFSKAVQVLEKSSPKRPASPALQRALAHALLLDQRPADARKILASLPAEGPADRRPAIAGALARTIEFYINEGDWESGEAAWDQWQRQYPEDFLEGYSLFLRTRLMELAKAPDAAAKVAEAFAAAVPRSSYAPRLLDRASRLLERSNPAKSAALRQMLKQKYPEDPLSQ